MPAGTPKGGDTLTYFISYQVSGRLKMWYKSIVQVD